MLDRAFESVSHLECCRSPHQYQKWASGRTVCMGTNMAAVWCVSRSLHSITSLIVAVVRRTGDGSNLQCSVPIIADQSRSRTMNAYNPSRDGTVGESLVETKQDHEVTQRMDLKHAMRQTYQLRASDKEMDLP